MKQGIFNKLVVNRRTTQGYYLIDTEENEVLLPNKYIPHDLKPGDTISVFVYKDSEDRIIATTLTPKILLNEFAVLEAIDINNIGAFLDWGLEKDLMVPFSEQIQRMSVGTKYPVYLYLDDKTDRLVATAKIDKYLEHDNITVSTFEQVDLLICNPTEIGINVIINSIHHGLLYDNELFQAVSTGEIVKGYVKQIRPDKKIDVMLQMPGYGNIEPNSQKIMEKLEENDGFLNLTDKSDPIVILAKLEMSKKTFKKSVGLLYKKHLIRIEDDGIYLTKNQSNKEE